MKITKRTNPNFKFSMTKKPKKSQKAKRKFASQTLSKKAKFVVFGLKKANMATLATKLPASRSTPLKSYLRHQDIPPRRSHHVIQASVTEQNDYDAPMDHC